MSEEKRVYRAEKTKKYITQVKVGTEHYINKWLKKNSDHVTDIQLSANINGEIIMVVYQQQVTEGEEE